MEYRPMIESRGFLLFFSLMAFSCSSSSTAPAETDAAADSVADETAMDSFPESGGCSSARETALKPIDAVSKGTVTSLASGTYVIDASAGGFDVAATNPWIYVSLETGMRVEVTDKQAFASSDWDLGLKRAVIRTNDGDSGPGGGGAQFLPGKPFDAVTKADATKLATEVWFDADCNPKVDATGAIQSTFDGWYDYAMSTMVVTPKSGTWIVRTAKGALYKLEIQDYYSKPDGSTGATGAHYKLRWAALG
jgi:hypothetical protein